jgi:hypothetical protein
LETVKPKSTGTASQRSSSEFLSWENLQAQTPGTAFRQTVEDLLLHPGRFFSRMATTGGLREPLTFFWLILAAGVLLSFPLALSCFMLTAPPPLEVSVEEYNAYLLPPRLAGFSTVLFPVTLVVAALGLLAAASVIHVGARLFGARNWQGSASIVIYSASAGFVPLVAVEALACLLSIICYLITVFWPGTAATFGFVAPACVYALLVACAAGLVLTLRSLVYGFTRSFGLDAASGIACTLAGVILLCAIAAGIGHATTKWGAKGALITTASALALIVIVSLVHVAMRAEKLKTAQSQSE